MLRRSAAVRALAPVLTPADTRLDATFVNTFTHTPEMVTITGRWPGDIVEIFWHGHLIAVIMRWLTKRDMLGQNTVSGGVLGPPSWPTLVSCSPKFRADHSTS